MKLSAYSIETGSRLHFGLLSFGHRACQPFGGLGLMIDSPTLRLTIEAAAQFECCGQLAERVRQFAIQWHDANKSESLPACRLTCWQHPRPHTGLGVGTQLAMSAARLLDRWTGRPDRSAIELAHSVGRGKRSAIGTHGHLHGGLLYEQGKPDPQSVAPLADRVQFPSSWRVVCVCHSDQQGLSGRIERSAFDRLPPVPLEITDYLRRLVEEHLLPAARERDFPSFAAGLYRYGRTAGNLFAPVQQGPFASERLADWVRLLRDRNVAGVGQSSWGPTLFAVQASQDAAEELRDWIQHRLRERHEQADVWIARAANQGQPVRPCAPPGQASASEPRGDQGNRVPDTRTRKPGDGVIRSTGGRAT